MEAISEVDKVVLSLDNGVIPNERLRNTPSAKDGCPHNLEVDLRVVGCEYIQTAGGLLELPQVARATAQVLFQRFLYSRSLIKYNMLHVAMASCFLAAKIEENCRRVRDVVNVFHHIKQKRMGRPVVPMKYLGEEYFKLKDSVIKYERFILRDLGFLCHVRHPHKLIIAYLQLLELDNKQLSQKAWNYTNDGLRTNIYVRFSPEAIACGCIFLAARQLKIALPHRPPWWTVFDVTSEDIEAIALELLSLYRWPRAFLAELEKKLDVLKVEYAKKQVEIKEVNLKKLSSTGPSSIPPSLPQLSLAEGATRKESSPIIAASNSQPSPQSSKPSLLSFGSSDNRSQKKPSPLVVNSSNNHHSPSPLSSSALVISSQLTDDRNNLRISPLALGKNSKPQVGRSPSDSPPSSKRKKISPIVHSLSSSPAPLENKSTKLSRRPISPGFEPIGKASSKKIKLKRPPTESSKPIISPIRVVSSGGSSENSPSLSRENGLPEQYRKNYNTSSTNNEHHHHHHHRHSRHHSSTRSNQEKPRRPRDRGDEKRGHLNSSKLSRTEHGRPR